MISYVTRRAVFIGASAIPFVSSVRAQTPTWPHRLMTFVVPFAAGGPVEPSARLIADHLARRLGQPAIVESRPGAAGSIGARGVVNSTDGHTFLFFTGSIATIPAIQKNPGFDLFRDLAPVSVISEIPMALAVRSDSTLRSVANLVERARIKPESISYGSSGPGSTTHLAWLLLQIRTGSKFLHAPYRGASASLNGLYTGEIDAVIGDLGLLLPHFREGKLRLLGVTSKARVALIPDIPALAETVPEYDIDIWHCLFAPHQTPPGVVDLLMRELAPLRENSPLSQHLAAGGGKVLLTGPSALTDRLRREVPLWRQVLQSAGIEPQ